MPDDGFTEPFARTAGLPGSRGAKPRHRGQQASCGIHIVFRPAEQLIVERVTVQRPTSPALRFPLSFEPPPLPDQHREEQNKASDPEPAREGEWVLPCPRRELGFPVAQRL